MSLPFAGTAAIVDTARHAPRYRLCPVPPRLARLSCPARAPASRLRTGSPQFGTDFSLEIILKPENLGLKNANVFLNIHWHLGLKNASLQHWPGGDPEPVGWRRRFPPHRLPCQGQGMPWVDGLDETSKARVLILKWKTDGLAREGSLAKDSTKIWNGLYCITWNTILRIPDPE